MTALTLALDWTPNINHIGFFVAKEKGFYTDVNISLDIVTPSADNYTLTPAKKVEMNLADFALCPIESIISYRTKQTPFELIAIAAILQEDLSAIVVNKEEKILSPKDLDTYTYASYKARYEDGIVQQMIKNDGGLGSIQIEYPEKLGIWDTILNKSYDATWIFTNWEGVEADQKKILLNYFRMKDYGIPYSYSPVIAANASLIETRREAYSNFISATKKGYLFAKDNIAEATTILQKVVPEKDQHIDLVKALQISASAFGDTTTWGKMDIHNVTTFLDWIYDKKLETQKLSVTDVCTNILFE